MNGRIRRVTHSPIQPECIAFSMCYNTLFVLHFVSHFRKVKYLKRYYGLMSWLSSFLADAEKNVEIYISNPKNDMEALYVKR